MVTAACPAPVTRRGFTIIELLVVLAAIALLLGIVAPRYLQHVDRAREAALRSNLAALRDALDRFHADRGRWPEALDELVKARYLRAIPVDPFTERSDTWQAVPPPAGEGGAVYDVRSSSPGLGSDGKAYAGW
jgi:general secretion pathway protein G